MEAKFKSTLEAVSIASLTLSTLEEMEQQEWTSDAKKQFSDAVGTNLESLPLGLQFIEREIDTTGSKTWEEQDPFFRIPGSSVVQLFNHHGRMRYGTSPDRYCGPTGVAAKAGSDHTQPGMNGGCFLVGVKDIVFINSRIAPGGASIGSEGLIWRVGEGQAGVVETAFNDSFDGDNSGYLIQTIRITPAHLFARLQKSLRQPLQ